MMPDVAPCKEDITQARAIAAALVVKMWRRGCQPKEISHKLGYSLSWVSARLRAQVGDASRYKTPRNERLADLWRADTPTHEIAAELGMTERGVISMVSVLRRRGEDIPNRKRGRRK